LKAAERQIATKTNPGRIKKTVVKVSCSDAIAQIVAANIFWDVEVQKRCLGVLQATQTIPG